MKWRQTGLTTNGVSMNLFLENQGCPKTPLCNTSTYTNVNGSTAEPKQLHSEFKRQKNSPSILS